MITIQLRYIMIMLLFVIFITVGIIHLFFKNVQEHMSDIPSTKYIPLHERNIKTDIIPTPPLMPIPHRFTSYDDYISFQQILRDKHSDMPSASSDEGAHVVSDINWRIHRWSLWDYIPDIQNAAAYWCRTQQYDGSEQCVPLSKKQYCRQGYLYKNPTTCLSEIRNTTKIKK